MVRVQQILTVGATFAVAAGIGFVMQNEDALASRIGPDVGYTTTAQLPETPFLAAAGGNFQNARQVSSEQQFAGADGAACDISMTAEPLPGAFVALEIDAPCRANMPGKIYHRGMEYSVLADEDGTISTTVPALSENALFIVAFDTGEGQMVSTDVPEAEAWERAVLQWSGDGIGLRMVETDRDAGMSRTLDPQTDLSRDDMVSLTVLGTYGPRAAQIATYPVGVLEDTDLAVEIEVTEANCDRPIAAQIWRTGNAKMQMIRAGAPGCDAVGRTVHLKTYETDINFAAN